MDKATIETILASLDERERDELAAALAVWLVDGALDNAPSDRWIRSALKAAAARRGIEINAASGERRLQAVRKGGL